MISFDTPSSLRFYYSVYLFKYANMMFYIFEKAGSHIKSSNYAISYVNYVPQHYRVAFLPEKKFLTPL